jgi:CheY-specific phosphatase CheX
MSGKIFVVKGKKTYSKNTDMVTPWGNASFDENGVAEVGEDIANFLMHNPQYEVEEKKAKKVSIQTETVSKGNSTKKKKKKTDPPAEESPVVIDDDDAVPGDVD